MFIHVSLINLVALCEALTGSAIKLKKYGGFANFYFTINALIMWRNASKNNDLDKNLDSEHVN